MLRRHVIELACNESARMRMGTNLKEYLDKIVNWDVVADQYNQAYELAREAQKTGKPVQLPMEF